MAGAVAPLTTAVMASVDKRPCRHRQRLQQRGGADRRPDRHGPARRRCWRRGGEALADAFAVAAFVAAGAAAVAGLSALILLKPHEIRTPASPCIRLGPERHGREGGSRDATSSPSQGQAAILRRRHDFQRRAGRRGSSDQPERFGPDVVEEPTQPRRARGRLRSRRRLVAAREASTAPARGQVASPSPSPAALAGREARELARGPDRNRPREPGPAAAASAPRRA